jgi:hypothetical protein
MSRNDSEYSCDRAFVRRGTAHASSDLRRFAADRVMAERDETLAERGTRRTLHLAEQPGWRAAPDFDGAELMKREA